MGIMTDHRKFRASDQDRDKVAEILRVAAGEGRISLEELTGRIDRAYAARTLGELDEIVSDLPGYGAPYPAAAPSPTSAGPPSRAPTEGDVLRLHTGSGRIVQAGRWTVPRHMSAEAGRWGRVRIDFTLADCPHREVLLDVEITSWFGDIVVVVPRGWWVHDEEVVRRRMGAVHNRPPVPLAPDGVSVRLTGHVQTGDVWVRYRRTTA
ncbi:hypothetical protein Ppa06_64000 [Planomonospora parontospora subsp. parontospora]|uniref:DUF1707 domain-containing protein n=3 Tax=Planomonospora parontospora TaxID=58119 RepID=A0AA37BPD1_9ACTN|nr:hypothetical protein GCM10010126_63760 [Planomonospora parontospora]GII12602.1 hypothetical protein Ppa06_64000 [Planomonospora parontospora subsp. parontospora]